MHENCVLCLTVSTTTSATMLLVCLLPNLYTSGATCAADAGSTGRTDDGGGAAAAATWAGAANILAGALLAPLLVLSAVSNLVYI